MVVQRTELWFNPRLWKRQKQSNFLAEAWQQPPKKLASHIKQLISGLSSCPTESQTVFSLLLPGKSTAQSLVFPIKSRKPK